VHVKSMKPRSKVPGIKRLKRQYDIQLSSFAYNFNLRRYMEVVCYNDYR